MGQALRRAATDTGGSINRRKLLDAYARALRRYLTSGGTTALRRASEIGRRAIAEGLDILEVVAAHHNAVAKLLLPAVSHDENQLAAEALAAFCASCPAWFDQAKEAGAAGEASMETFLAKTLSPFARQHRGLRKANALLLRMNELREEEARRLSHALHDDAAQLLFSVHLAVEEIARELDPPLRERVREIRPLLDKMEEQLRELAHELRPTLLDDLGLAAALEFLAQGITKRAGVRVTVQSEMCCRLPRPVETAVYRAAQEAMKNVVRHAQASQVTVRLRRSPRRVVCAIRDDGVGFDVHSILAQEGERGLGLMGMHERIELLGGSLTIRSWPDQGTEIAIKIPVKGRHAATCAVAHPTPAIPPPS